MPTPTIAELIERYGEPDDMAQDPSNLSNRERADMALDAVNAFAKRSYNNPAEQQFTLDEIDDPDAGFAIEVIGDLICNLLHLGVLCGLDADDLIAQGLSHFTAEVGMGYE